MSHSSKVSIRIESRQQDEATIQHLIGTMYQKANTLYLRYQENISEWGDVSTTISITDHRITIIRRGALQSEQRFILHQSSIGFHETIHGRFDLLINTSQIMISQIEDTIQVQWSYDLYSDESHLGLYELKLMIQEEPMQ
jgi:uncharacterized beta-barrel protein YwiB (DUF1934 family)